MSGFIDSNSYGCLWIWYGYGFYMVLYCVLDGFPIAILGLLFFLHYDSYGLMLDFGRIFRWMIFLTGDL